MRHSLHTRHENKPEKVTYLWRGFIKGLRISWKAKTIDDWNSAQIPECIKPNLICKQWTLCRLYNRKAKQNGQLKTEKAKRCLVSKNLAFTTTIPFSKQRKRLTEAHIVKFKNKIKIKGESTTLSGYHIFSQRFKKRHQAFLETKPSRLNAWKLSASGWKVK